MEPEGSEDRRAALGQAQPFDLFAGMRLIGVSSNGCHSAVNGGFLTVGAVRESDCDVRGELGNTFALSHEQVCRSTRLAWAITVTASQSREFECAVCLWDLDSRRYSKRHLYVALSHVKRPGTLVVAPA